MDPTPPRKIRPEIPDPVEAIILKAMEKQAEVEEVYGIKITNLILMQIRQLMEIQVLVVVLIMEVMVMEVKQAVLMPLELEVVFMVMEKNITLTAEGMLL